MKITIISPGKDKDLLLSPFVTEFEKRLTPFTSLSWIYPQKGTKESEEKDIVSHLEPGDIVVLLDEKGKQLSSTELSSFLDAKQNESVKRLVFIIGGAYGAGDGLKARANIIVSLGKLTYPHLLVRAILVEQLYRGFSLLHGSKYHHG